MNSTLPDPAAAHFDVRSIPCRIKHGLIFARWHELAVGEYFVLVNDHDPVPLYYQFQAEFPHAFRWDYEARGPEEFAVRITRIAPTPPPAEAAPAAARTCGHHGLGTVDARGLEPPEPMARILDAVTSLAPHTTLIALTDRQPLHLLPELDRRGCTHQGEAQPDGSWRTVITRGAA